MAAARRFIDFRALAGQILWRRALVLASSLSTAHREEEDRPDFLRYFYAKKIL